MDEKIAVLTDTNSGITPEQAAVFKINFNLAPLAVVVCLIFVNCGGNFLRMTFFLFVVTAQMALSSTSSLVR